MDMETNLWPGLASYDEKGTYKFCGRNQIINDIYSLVKNHTFVTLYGKSGIGKTSVLRAGVTPILKRSNFYPLYIRLSQQKNQQQKYYASSIISQIEEHLTCVCTKSYSPLPADNVDYLWNWFSHNQCHDAQGNIITPVIILDQFEEIFFDNNKDAELLLRQLYCITDGSHYVNPNECWDAYQEHVRFVFSLRDDSLYHLEELINKHHLDIFRQNRYALRALNKDEALEVILLPSEGLISDSVANSIIEKVQSQNDADSVDSAFLSLLLSELYSQTFLQGKPLTQEIVEAYSDDVIQNYYDQGIEGIEIDAIQYFEEHLVSGDGRRRFVSKQDLVEHGITESILQSLEQKHIITQLPRGQYIDYELTHDVLCGVATAHKQKRIQALKDLAARQQERIQILWHSISQVMSFIIICLSLFSIHGWDNILHLLLKGWCESYLKVVVSIIAVCLPFISSIIVNFLFDKKPYFAIRTNKPFKWCLFGFSIFLFYEVWTTQFLFITTPDDCTYFALIIPLLYIYACYPYHWKSHLLSSIGLLISYFFIPSAIYNVYSWGIPYYWHYYGMAFGIIFTAIVLVHNELIFHTENKWISWIRVGLFVLISCIICLLSHGYPVWKGWYNKLYVCPNHVNHHINIQRETGLGVIDGRLNCDSEDEIIPCLFDTICYAEVIGDSHLVYDCFMIKSPAISHINNGLIQQQKQYNWSFLAYSIDEYEDVYHKRKHERVWKDTTKYNDSFVRQDIETYCCRTYYQGLVGLLNKIRFGEKYKLSADTSFFNDAQTLLQLCSQKINHTKDTLNEKVLDEMVYTMALEGLIDVLISFMEQDNYVFVNDMLDYMWYMLPIQRIQPCVKSINTTSTITKNGDTIYSNIAPTIKTWLLTSDEPLIRIGAYNVLFEHIRDLECRRLEDISQIRDNLLSQINSISANVSIEHILSQECSTEIKAIDTLLSNYSSHISSKTKNISNLCRDNKKKLRRLESNPANAIYLIELFIIEKAILSIQSIVSDVKKSDWDEYANRTDSTIKARIYNDSIFINNIYSVNAGFEQIEDFKHMINMINEIQKTHEDVRREMNALSTLLGLEQNVDHKINICD